MSRDDRADGADAPRDARRRALFPGCVGIAVCLLLAGCAAPFGVRRASPEKVHRSLTANVLTTGKLSNFSEIVLHRKNLTIAYAENPEAALHALHEELRAGRLANDDLFVLAELSFHHASGRGGEPHYLAAAAYSYAYVFPDDPLAAPPPFDPRQRVAMDLYNRALTEAFESTDTEEVEIAAGTYPLPFGQMEVDFDDRQLLWGSRRLAGFTPTAELEVTGFRNRYRQPGIGAPLAAATEPLDPSTPVRDFVGPNVRVPVTALLRLPNPRQQLEGETLHGVLEIHPATEEASIAIAGRQVPLEQEPTAALALTLAVGRPWAQELGAFFGQVLQIESAPALGAREPHRRGRIPVVFVHGTASNLSVWANMLNDLESDPILRRHFEFWFFRYDSGQPILYSGTLLRRALNSVVQELQAEHRDSCLDAMVVIGHSQGGLLVKLTAIDSEDAFWRNVSGAPFAEAKLSEKTRELVEEVMFVEPLPYVNRVVFIATPHGGSYLAGPGLVRRLARRLITLPATVARGGAELLASDSARSQARLETLPTSIDNMSPGNPFIMTIAKISVAPGITAHSIVGVVDDEPLESGGDGVVKYRSAHIEGVESELILPYPHSMQSEPEVVAEVQRILHLHLERNPCRDVPRDLGGAEDE